LAAKAVSKQIDVVPITYSITNNGDTLLYNAASYPLISIYKDNTEIEGYTLGRNFVGVLPGSTFSLQYTWDQKDATGNVVEPGTYIVKGTYLTDVEQVTITVQ
jgi:hypothetical protein